MHGEMSGRHHQDKTRKWIMKFLSEEDQKKLALMKMDMKIARVEQRLEYLKSMREMLEKKM